MAPGGFQIDIKWLLLFIVFFFTLTSLKASFLVINNYTKKGALIRGKAFFRDNMVRGSIHFYVLLCVGVE